MNNPVELAEIEVDGSGSVDADTSLLTLVVTRKQDVGGVISGLTDKLLASSRTTSGTHVSQAVVIDLRNLGTSLSIHMAASGGTATLVVEASVDNINWIQADSIAAAAATIKVYGSTTAGAASSGASGGPIAPLSFRYIRITAGDAGVGNTTTLTIAAK